MAAAIDEVILNVLPPETGGMIGVDAQGNKNKVIKKRHDTR
jgi:hypothetical protein